MVFGSGAWLSTDEIAVPLRYPNGAARVNTTTGEVLVRAEYMADVCENPGEAVTSADGRLFIVCEGDHYRPGAIVRVNRETLDVEARVRVGIYPDRLALREP